MNLYLEKSCRDFNLSRTAVISLKCAMKISYEEYYHIIKDRFETLQECQELCVEVRGYELRSLFNDSNSPYTFLSSLYTIRDKVPNKLLIAKCKQAIKFIKSKEYKEVFGNDK